MSACSSPPADPVRDCDCSDTEYCQQWFEVMQGGGLDYHCAPTPPACADAPSCDCLTAEVPEAECAFGGVCETLSTGVLLVECPGD